MSQSGTMRSHLFESKVRTLVASSEGPLIGMNILIKEKYIDSTFYKDVIRALQTIQELKEMLNPQNKENKENKEYKKWEQMPLNIQ